MSVQTKRTAAANKSRRLAQKRATLDGISPAMVDAMRELSTVEPDALPRLVVLIGERVSPREDSAAAVESYAVARVASLYLPLRGTVGALDRAAGAAVSFARATAREVAALEASMSTGYGLADDLATVEEVGGFEALPGYAGNASAPRPDGRYVARGADAIAALMREARASLPARDAVIVSLSLTAYAAHVEDGTCEACEGKRATKRPTLLTVLAHTRGESSDSATAKRVARVLRSFMTTERHTAVNDALAVPLHGKPGRVHLSWPDRAPVAAEVTVMDADGVTDTRPMTEEEEETFLAPTTRTPRAGYAGEGRDSISTAPDARSAAGPVPSGKVPVSPRKRGGTGNTGPTVPARF